MIPIYYGNWCLMQATIAYWEGVMIKSGVMR